MGIGQRSLEETTTDKAEDLAEQRYGRPFGELTPSLQIQTWMEAENEAKEEFIQAQDGIYDEMREASFSPPAQVK